MEGIRISGAHTVHRQAKVADSIPGPDGTKIDVKPGDRIFLTSSHDEIQFPEPTKVDPKRPLDSYIHYNGGPQSTLGPEITHIALVELLRAAFGKKNFRRAVGPQGQLKKILTPEGETYLTEDWSAVWPFPTTMKAQWDQ